MLDRGGKRWRSVLVMLIGEALGGNYDIYSDLVAVSEIVHNGTLAIDDIEDSSEFRRGKKAMHLLFGIDIAVNAGNAMYFLPLQVLKAKASLLPAEKILRLYEIYSQEMINLHFGQVLPLLTGRAWTFGGTAAKMPATPAPSSTCRCVPTRPALWPACLPS